MQQGSTFTHQRLGQCAIVCVEGKTAHFVRSDRAEEVMRGDGEPFDAWVSRLDGHEVEVWRCDLPVEAAC